MAQQAAQQRYRVLERLASGGMAEVFVAESAGIEGFKKVVAIKRVLPHLSEKKRFIAMFLDEARLSANLSHSNVVQVFDIGVGDNTYFIVMEYVDGSDLKAVGQHLRETGKPFPVEAAIYISTKICEGLAYAHEMTNAEGEPLHAVHRDISPPNVLLSKHGEVKIVDFGLAKASTQLEKSEAGIIKGKFSYLSPEAAHGQEVDHRADIFAVGIILWELLAGRKLFQGTSDYETVKLVQRGEVPPISRLNPDADTHLDGILARALAVDRDGRYPSARTLGQDLTRYLYRLGKPVSAFDVAELVRGPYQLRKTRRDVSEGASIIDKLIQETLLQFTSLQDQGGGAPAAAVEHEPFNVADFEAIGRWADELGRSGPRERQSALLMKNTLPADALEEGNLAALEGPEEPLPRGRVADAFDDTTERSSRPASLRASKERTPPSGQALPPPPTSTSGVAVPSTPVPIVDEETQIRSPGATALKALLLVMIAAGTAAAVWFSGLL
jgi:serine/threonine-protein kinase